MRKELHRIALARTTTHAAAEDLIEDALIRVLDPEDAPWDPEEHAFVRHMKFVMRQTWDQKMRRACVQREVLDGGVKGEKRARGDWARADDEVDGVRWLGLRASLLEEVVGALEAEHPLVRPICELGAQGIETPSEQAQSLGCSVQAVYDAFATLKRHARKALMDWDRAERRRMMMAQAPATAPADETAEEKEVTA
jgi:DNA-directed RNA polymerase specialized sigma24 family protein